MTRNGLLLDADSAPYLRHAELISSNLSTLFRMPTDGVAIGGQFPPGYPLALSIVGADVTDLGPARWLQVGLAGISLAVIGLLLRRHVGQGPAVVAGLVLILTRGFLLRLHGLAMSEALFLLFLLITLFALDRALDVTLERAGNRTWWWTGIASLSACLAFLTRFVGIGLVAAVAASLLLMTPDRRRGVTAAVVGLVVGAATPVVWVLAQASRSVVGERPLSWFPIRGVDITDFLDTIGLFVLPNQVMASPARFLVRVTIVVGLLLGIRWSARLLRTIHRNRAELAPLDRVSGVLTVFLLVHGCTLVAARLFLEAGLLLDARQVLPMWTIAVVLVAIRLGPGVPPRIDAPVPARSAAFAVLLLMIMVMMTPVFVRSIAAPSESSYDHRTRLRDSQLIEVVRRLPTGARVVSDRTDLVYLATGRVASTVPTELDQVNQRPNDAFRSEIRAVARRLAHGRGVVVLFEEHLAWSARGDRIVRETGMRLVRRSDGVSLDCPDDCPR